MFCPPGSLYDGAKHLCINRHEKVTCGPQPTTQAPITTTDPNAAPPCDPVLCQLPECFCSNDGTKIPGDLPRAQTPQLVMITFDGAVNHLNFDTYNTIFLENRTSPNGCPIRATFFMTHDYNDYSKVQEMYSQGHEMAVASVSRRQGLEDESAANWTGEMVTMREILKNYASVNTDEVIGMRAPHLKPGRNAQFEMIYDYNFVWDSSMVVPPQKIPVWPYTLDYKIPHECKSGTCPTGSFPGIWEIPMNSHYMDERFEGGYCPYLDQCGLNFFSENDVFEWLKSDFHRHYDKNRAPYMIAVSVNWFNTPANHKGLLRFIDYTLSLYMKTCSRCPSSYPWVFDARGIGGTNI
ncbi:hypothetical protein Anas_01331 [Armadillidium nasatum]|uniref:Chitin-binding type-2 domain-containing protein n=1 Tax=Armadillidium nasatum TaxID=96803 RepID=A0A5N5SSW2_9CRUS|nr:hypothetical protein Anas_01331 [Armadillidium nasatum]